jgi:hypothetical protein
MDPIPPFLMHGDHGRDDDTKDNEHATIQGSICQSDKEPLIIMIMMVMTMLMIVHPIHHQCRRKEVGEIECLHASVHHIYMW